MSEEGLAVEDCGPVPVSKLKTIKFRRLSEDEQWKLKIRGRATPLLNLTQKCVQKGKTYVRKFARVWYDRKKWLCGCEETTALYCFPCLLLGASCAWTEDGVTNVSKLSQRTVRHEQSRTHLLNVLALAKIGQQKEIENEILMKEQKMAATELKRKNYIKKSATINVKNLSPMVSNELLKEAFSKFGKVERAVVIVDHNGQSTTRGIVEFKNELCARNAVQQIYNRCFLITSTPRVISATMMEQEDSECGLLEQDLTKSSLYHSERTYPPRFAVPGSFEEQISKTWKARYELERNQRQAFERSMKKARDIFELEIESLVHDHRSSKIREEALLRKLGRKAVNDYSTASVTEKPLEVLDTGVEVNFSAQKTAAENPLAPELIAARILQQINNSGVGTLTPWNANDQVVGVGTKETSQTKNERKRRHSAVDEKHSVVVPPPHTLKIALPRLHRNSLWGRRKLPTNPPVNRKAPTQRKTVKQQLVESRSQQLQIDEKDKTVDQTDEQDRNIEQTDGKDNNVSNQQHLPLPSHKKIQALVNQHKCSICSDGFPTKELYDSHMHKHTQQFKLPYSDHFYYTLPPGAKEFRRKIEFKIKTVELSGGEKVKVQIWKVGGRDQSEEFISNKSTDTRNNENKMDDQCQVRISGEDTTEIIQDISIVCDLSSSTT